MSRSEPRYLAAFGIFASIGLILAGPQIWPVTEISTLPYDAPDSNIFLWNFWWTREALSSFSSPWWTDRLFHPLGTSLAFHSYPVPYSLLSLPFQLAAPGPAGLAAAFNVVVLLSFVTSGFFAYLLVQRVTDSREGAAIAGILFAFGPFHFLNMARLHVVAIECLPLYLLALLQLGRRPHPAAGAMLGGALAFAYYTSLEYALHLALFSVLWLVFVLARRRVLISRPFVTALATATGVFLVVASPLLAAQAASLAASGAGVERSLDEARRWSPALLSLFAPSRLHPWFGEALSALGEYGDSGITGMRSEASLGTVRWLLVAVALLGFRRDGRAFWILAAATFTSLALGPYLRVSGTWSTDIPLPYRALYELVPPLRAGRDPTRFLAIASLLLSVVAAFGARDLLQKVSEGRNRVIATGILALLCIFEGLVSRPGSLRLEPDAAYAQLPAEPSALAVMDLSPATDALLAQTLHGRPITWVGNLVPRSASADAMLPVELDFRQPMRALREPSEAADALRSESLRDLGIGLVVLPRGGPQTPRQIRLARRMGAQIDEFQQVVVCDFGKVTKAGDAPPAR